MGSRRNRIAVLVACLVVAVAVVLVVASRPRSSPAPAAKATPSAPTTPASTAPPASPSPSPAPSARSTQPAASPLPSPPPSSSPTHGPSPSPSPSPPSGGLVAGPWGFSYPAGWSVGPLVTRNAQAQTATVTDPAGPGRIDYLKDTSTAIYNPDHTVNETVVATAIEAAFPCSQMLTATQVPDKGFRYTCTPVSGNDVTGMALVAPYAQGVRVVQVTMPPADDALAAAIVAGFH